MISCHSIVTLSPLPLCYQSFSPSPCWKPLVWSLHLWVLYFSVLLTSLLYFVDSMYKWYHTVFLFLCLTYFTKHNAHHSLSMMVQMAKFHSSLWLSNSWFYIYHIFIHPSIDEYLGCFHTLASATINTGLHVFFQSFPFIQIYAQEWNCWLIW